MGIIFRGWMTPSPTAKNARQKYCSHFFLLLIVHYLLGGGAAQKSKENKRGGRF